MKTYYAKIKIQIGSSIKNLDTEVRALNSNDAKWLLQAVYGFHSITSGPSEILNTKIVKEIDSKQTPDQQRIENLKTAKNRANKALEIERDRQKRASALKTIRNLTN